MHSLIQHTPCEVLCQMPDSYLPALRAAFKFGRRVHFALRRKMLNPPIARLPAIEVDFINCPSAETDCVYEKKVKWTSTQP